jgi:hypothetical protein
MNLESQNFMHGMRAQDDKVAVPVAGELRDSVAFSSNLDAFLNGTRQSPERTTRTNAMHPTGSPGTKGDMLVIFHPRADDHASRLLPGLHNRGWPSWYRLQHTSTT